MYELSEKIETVYFPIDYTATPVAWFKGTASYMNNNLKQAMQYYELASKQAPYHVQVYNDIGAVYMNTGDNATAQKYFSKALELNPKFPDALFNRAIAVFNSGNKYGAYKLFKEVNEINPPPKYNDYMLVVVNEIADSVFKSEDINLKTMPVWKERFNPSNVWAVETGTYNTSENFINALHKEINLFRNSLK